MLDNHIKHMQNTPSSWPFLLRLIDFHAAIDHVAYPLFFLDLADGGGSGGAFHKIHSKVSAPEFF